jgi:hypothetical protein
MSARHLWRATAFGILIMSAWLLGRHASTQQALRTQQIFMTAIEIKGSTTTDNLASPAVNPVDLSQGYGFKGPGEADKTGPQQWEVASTPSLQDSSPCRRETP